jgi:hypothetical protein
MYKEMSTNVKLSCPPGLKLSNSYTDPDNASVLCEATPTQTRLQEPQPLPGSSFLYNLSDNSGSGPEPGPGDSCSESYVPMKDENNKKTCEPIICPSGSIKRSYTSNDANHNVAYGCAPLSAPATNDHVYISNIRKCPYNSVNIVTDGKVWCSMKNDNNPVLYVTDNQNNCPPDHEMVNDTTLYPQCQTLPYGEHASMGNIIATITFGLDGNYKGMGGNLQTGGKCPFNSEYSYLYPDINGGIGCINKPSTDGPNEVLICPIGYEYISSSSGPNKPLTCRQLTSYTEKDKGNCISGYTPVNDSFDNLVCKAIPAQFTNVYDSKSKKERKVESFSQNTNGKCKARY